MSEEQVAEVPAEGVAQSVETEDWRGMIPEEIRGHRSLESIKDIGSLAKSYVNAQSMIGADKVVIPSANANDDVWNEFYAKVGRPEEPGGYSIETSEGDMPEMVDWFRSTAHELGLNNRQASELFARYNEFASGVNESGLVDRDAFIAQTEASLREEYGEAFGDRLENGRAIVETFGNPEIMETQLSDGTYLGDHPEFIKMVAEIGEFISSRMGEDQLEGMKETNTITPDDARKELENYMRRPGPYWDNQDPQHDHYVQEVARLNGLIYQ